MTEHGVAATSSPTTPSAAHDCVVSEERDVRHVWRDAQRCLTAIALATVGRTRRHLPKRQELNEAILTSVASGPIISRSDCYGPGAPSLVLRPPSELANGERLSAVESCRFSIF